MTEFMNSSERKMIDEIDKYLPTQVDGFSYIYLLCLKRPKNMQENLL